MDDFESKIQDVLNDPAQMAQILKMAENLGLQSNRHEPTETPNVANAPQQSNKQTALLNALIPYLTPEKQKRLSRAVKIGKLAQIAGISFLQNKESE